MSRALLLALMLAFPAYTHADPVMRAEADGVVITLYDEPCRLTAIVTNLPMRATWIENGATVEGCWSIHPQARIVMSYWSDKTVGLIPLGVLKRVIGS